MKSKIEYIVKSFTDIKLLFFSLIDGVYLDFKIKYVICLRSSDILIVEIQRPFNALFQIIS